MIKKIIFVFILSLFISCEKKHKKEVVVSVAASLAEGIKEIAEAYKNDTGVEVKINIGSSGSLKKQMENGAPVDFIFLASKNYVEDLAGKNILTDEKDLLENTLVVASEKRLSDLDEIDGLVAIGNPGFVPAGEYAKEAFEKSGLWKKIEKNVLYTKDVRSALSYINRGEVEYSVVYQTDTRFLNGKEIYEIDKSKYSPIIYSSGVKKDSIEGQRFNNYLLQNIDVFAKYEFKVRSYDHRSN